ncbi:RluA family pseudouridine synthase [Mogibacterium neglectum]|uniref:RluA family pseudouridine synthase n=1 Tax=Mogibacterium neglectum TaxID=114528 RepID=UPI00272A2818|nr:RluA family pseudouridine synthase [Mogibacterium neglectum]WLD75552.1 RluA family pseudouridine synthase [Mogibacterium neglectum]
MGKYNHTVTDSDIGLSINQIIKANFKFSSRFKTKMKFQKLVDLNGTPTPGFIIPEVGDEISIRLPEETSNFPAEDIPIDVLYEDDDLMFINKQPGLIVHPTKGHPFHTIANGLMKYMLNNGQKYKIRFANRIDMDTSGIVIVAKNANSQNDISLQMRENLVHKQYMAIVNGVIRDDEFTIDKPIGRPNEESIQRKVLSEGGKDAITDVKVLERFYNNTLVEVTLHTGRTHQIRVHLTHIGHPITGDHLYEGDAPALIDRQALHAAKMIVNHPMTGEKLEIEAPLPNDMKKCLAILRK